MRLPLLRLLPVLALAALLAPGLARADDASIVSRDVALRGERTLAAAAPKRFSLVGLHWQGRGSVEFRTRSLAGRWSAWQQAAPEAEDLPDRSSGERRRGAWRLGNPWWTGPSDAIRYRLHGDVRRLRAWFVWSPEVRVPARSLALAGSPAIVARSAWRADESIVRAKPALASRIRFSLVHHTAGQNAYSAAESAAIVRSIQLYHVKGNGWNDIGYNFLVDRFGTVFEGRGGGRDRNVVGAHAEGFNTGSVGVAVLGEYGSASVAPAAESALARLLAWRLDVAHLDPLTTLSAISGGNARYASGLPVFLRAVSGHRDTGFTSCPGNRLYARLDAIAAAVGATGLPKLYEPAVTGGLGGQVRFRARLSSAQAWRASVTDATGFEVAAGSGFGATVSWSWDARAVLPGSYRWRIDGGSQVLPATGLIGRAGTTGPLAVTGFSAEPEAVSPNDDGQADKATLTYTLSAPATVSVDAYDSVGANVATVLRPTRKAAGEHILTYDPLPLIDGSYELVLTAIAADGTATTASAGLRVSRTLGSLVVPAAFSPNSDGRKDRLPVRFSLANQADVRVRVLRDGKYVTTIVKGRLGPGPQRLDWDGSKRLGRLLDGSYEAVVEATDPVGLSALRLPFVSDTRVPVVRVLPGKPLRVWVSEPSLLTLRVNGRSLRQEALRAGELHVAWRGPTGRVRAVAWDAAGNVSKPALR